MEDKGSSDRFLHNTNDYPSGAIFSLEGCPQFLVLNWRVRLDSFSVWTEASLWLNSKQHLVSIMGLMTGY